MFISDSTPCKRTKKAKTDYSIAESLNLQPNNVIAERIPLLSITSVRMGIE